MRNKLKWKDGSMEAWKDSRIEGWKDGSPRGMEGWDGPSRPPYPSTFGDRTVGFVPTFNC